MTSIYLYENNTVTEITYVNDHNLKVRITMPSLVNHRVIPSLHSLTKSQLHT